MADNGQDNSYVTNTTGRSANKNEGATLIPAKKKHVSTMMVECVVNSATKMATNIKNKNKINPR